MIYEALLENCKRYFVFKMIASQKVDNGNNLDLSRGPSTLSILYCVNSELSHYDLFKRKTMNFGVLLCTADEGREIILKATFISCPFTKSPKKYTCILPRTFSWTCTKCLLHASKLPLFTQVWVKIRKSGRTEFQNTKHIVQWLNFKLNFTDETVAPGDKSWLNSMFQRETFYTLPLLLKSLYSSTAEQIRKNWSDWSVDASGFEGIKCTELIVRCWGSQRRKVERFSTCSLWEFVFELEVWGTKAEQSFIFGMWVPQAAGAERRSLMGNLQKDPRTDICLTWLFVRFSLSEKRGDLIFHLKKLQLKTHTHLQASDCGKFHAIIRSLSFKIPNCVVSRESQ